ncbi:DUF6220 domain-containing protein [Virgibacillus oceani]|uniref:Uncharacterized protein n=1 Tax=Virgibacillus oceani TaxID=1479511 RepID=A0A917H8X9_9BACI|nr:DUF6220 domain-containing protein [Virgibacillus oceani]GGG71805.1 hypothetical protein GCM10011398_15150 [Virgibacillus oceani]
MRQRKSRLVLGTFALLAVLFFLSILVQVFLAGIAIFVNLGQWYYHTAFVHYVEFIPIVMLILSFFGAIPKSLRWQCAGLYLMIVLQYITIQLSGSVPYLTALHPVIALLLFWRSLVTARTAIGLVKT